MACRSASASGPPDDDDNIGNTLRPAAGSTRTDYVCTRARTHGSPLSIGRMMWAGCWWMQYSAVLWNYGGIRAPGRIHLLAMAWQWETVMGRFMETCLTLFPFLTTAPSLARGTADSCLLKNYSKEMCFKYFESTASFWASWFWLHACVRVMKWKQATYQSICVWFFSPFWHLPPLKKKNSKGSRFRKSTHSPPPEHVVLFIYSFVLICDGKCRPES